ncbi:MAG: succinylglutamate desuccinylase/aspartoacylase family protein [Myxococcota bacterium]
MTSEIAVRVTDRVDGIPGTRLYEAMRGDTPEAGALVAIVGVMHGNEPVGAKVLERLALELPEKMKAGRILAVHANLRAWTEGVRHTEDGVDLNRLWDRRTLASLGAMPPESLCYEEHRALELAPLLTQCDALLDLHSTSRPSEAFLLFRDDQRHASMARNLSVRNLVTGMHESAVVDGGLCSNIGLDPGELSRRLGFTFEAGQHSDAGNLERAWIVTIRMLAQLGLWAGALPDEVVPHEIYEVLDRFPQAPAGGKPWRFVPPETILRKNAPRALESFEEVEADEMIVRRGDTVVRANAPFTMLMPAPDARPGADLFFYAQRRHGGLSSGEYRTNSEARREARAIERMLDLLSGDSMEEGVTWVSFDNRRCLDLCADLIGRTLRMPPGHPDRRITVVGRGDWGGGETERRNGLRYRQAMRRAIRAGVPIERMQVLRGASLGWLDALTSASMLHIQKRDPGTSVKLLLSVQQPHTVSVLVVGDLEEAIRTGNQRDCRVAILIEAATVEPDEETARVRVVRTGVIGARIELLRAARNVIRALRQEHRHLVEDTRLFHDAELGPLVGPDGVLESRPDPSLIEKLRCAVLKLQLRLWCDSLRSEVPGTLNLTNSRALGRWLASIMTRSGILDVDSLRRLLIRPNGGGWVADLDRLERLATRATSQDLDDLLLAPPPRPSPRQPIIAADVDGDNLERWIGWKRYLRGYDVIHAERGKDLDLVFSERGIRDRITRWLKRAQELAAQRPGQVMIVMAGDGLNPNREEQELRAGLLQTHRDVLVDPNVRYLRIQHAQGTHLAWMKHVIETLSDRPDDGQPVALLFEAEHGATVNVVMVCVREGETDPWSLEGWNIECCAAVVSDLETRAARDYKLALFTERMGERREINQELLHFGRAHCEGLLKQVGWRARGERGAPAPGAIEHMFCQHLERWVEQVRALGTEGVIEAPTSDDDRADWVARQLGIADHTLARALAAEMTEETPAEAAARKLWVDAHAWPTVGDDDMGRAPQKG